MAGCPPGPESLRTRNLQRARRKVAGTVRMRRYLLDTNSAADCIFRRRGLWDKVKEARLAGGKIGIGIPVLAELLGGVEYSASRDKNLATVNRSLHLF